MKIAIGSDHCGYVLKQQLMTFLTDHYEVKDCGCYSAEPVDFPDIAKQVCREIKEGRAERGIMFCGTGVGAAIACNKVNGIRASVVHDIYSAHQCVEHDNCQVMAVGAQIIGDKVAADLIRVFTEARFLPDEEFHRRVKKLESMNEEQ
ncbi:MAG: RpiB/LacA/LacB family sugar-phosphate isomerase [Clostridium sp.]|nr:RpiB/LacA/LacB family sugar-phosphate isomerase [Clostridium sp.]